MRCVGRFCSAALALALLCAVLPNRLGSVQEGPITAGQLDDLDAADLRALRRGAEGCPELIGKSETRLTESEA